MVVIYYCKHMFGKKKVCLNKKKFWQCIYFSVICYISDVPVFWQLTYLSKNFGFIIFTNEWTLNIWIQIQVFHIYLFIILSFRYSYQHYGNEKQLYTLSIYTKKEVYFPRKASLIRYDVRTHYKFKHGI